jgi:hypothetical protein
MPDPKKTKLSPGELLEKLHDMAEEDRMEDEAARIAKMSDGEAAAEMRAAGGDPDAIGKRGAAFVEGLLRGEPAWKAKAKARAAVAHEAIAKVPKTPATMPRAEVLARIDAARKNPRFSAPVAAFFRKRKPEETSDAELREMLDELNQLEAIARAEGVKAEGANGPGTGDEGGNGERGGNGGDGGHA